MTPQERVAALKAARRAELEAAQKALADAAETARQQAEQNFGADLHAALELLDASWLLPLYAADFGRHPWTDDDDVQHCSARFNIEGHRVVTLLMTLDGEHWRPDGDRMWAGTRADGVSAYYVNSLADALIDAEINPDADPIPF